MKALLQRLILLEFLALLLTAPLRADLYWGGGTSNIANGTALPTTTAGGNGTWNTGLQNWAISQNGSSYGAWANNQVANFGFYSNNATEAVTIAGNHTIGGLVFSNQPATALNLLLTLNASSAQTLTLAGSSALFLITSSSATSGISIGNNITLGSGSTTLTKDGAGRLVFGSSSGTANSNAFTGPLSVVSGLVLLDTASSMNGIPTASVSTYRSDIASISATNTSASVAYTTPIFQVNLANAAGSKLSDSLVVTLQRGEFNLQGGGASGTETIGQIQLAPYGYLNTSSATAGTTLTLGNGTVGIDRGTTGLGTMVIGASGSDALPVNVVLSNTTGLSKDSLLPWLTTSRAEFVQLSSSNNTLTRIASTTANSNASNWASSYNATSNLRVTTTLSGALGSNLTVNSYGILGSGTSSLLEIGAGNTLTINSGAISMAGNGNRQYGFSNGTLTSGTDKLYLHTGVVNSSTLSINSSISGTLDIIKSGTVGASLGGTVANTYSGNLIVNSGDLDLQKSGAVTGAAFVRGGALLAISNATALAATSNVTVDKKGVLVHGTSANLGGAITLNGGQILQANSDPTFSGSGFGLQFNGGLYTFSNGNTTKTANLLTNVSYAGSSTESAVIRNISTGTANLTIQLNTGASAGNAERVFQINDSLSLAADAAEMVVEVAIANGGSGTTTGSLRKTGNGTLQFLAPMTYSGGTVIDAGTLQLSTLSRDAKTGLTGTTSTLTPKTLTFVEPVASTFIVGQTLNGTNLAAGAKIIDILNDYQVVMSASASATGSAANIASGNLSLTGRLAGNVTINSGGTLLVDGNTTFSSGSSIAINSGGFLRLGANGTAGSIGTNSTLSNNGTIVFQRSNTLTQGTDFASGISGTGTLLQAGAGTTILAGTNSFNGTVSVQSGSLVLSGANAVGNSASLVIGNIGATLSVNASQTAGTLSGNGSVLLASGQTLTLASSSSTTFDGQIQGAGNLAKAGSGTLTLSGSNTYTGATTISAGTLAMGASNVFANSSDVNISAGAVLSMGGFNDTIAKVYGAGSVDLGSGNLTTTYGSGSATFSGVISGNGSLTLAGPADYNAYMTISGSNTYTGATNVNGATLILGADNVISSSSNLVISGGRLSASNRNQTFHSLTMNSGAILRDGGTLAFSNGAAFNGGSVTIRNNGGAISSTGTTTLGNVTFTYNASTSGFNALLLGGNVVVTSGASALFEMGPAGGQGFIKLGNTNRVFDVGENAAATVNWVIHSTNNLLGALTKNGSGTLVLNAINLYTGGTTINAGTLVLGNASDTLANAAAVTVNGGTLSLGSNSDTIGALTLTGGSITGTTGVLTASSLTLQNGTVSAILAGSASINKTTSGALTLAGNNTLSGGITLSAGQLNLNASGALGSGNFTIQGGSLGNTSGSSVTISSSASQFWNADFTYAGPNDLNLGTGAVAMNATRTITVDSGTLTVGGAISGSGFGLTKNGTGTLTLSGNNTYSGATTIAAGTISINAASALASTSAINLGNATSLTYTGGTATLNRTISVTSGTGSLRNTGGGTLTLGGTLSKNGTTLTFAQGVFNVTGSITGSSADSDLVVDSSTVTLNGVNTYDGPTYIINGGTLNANVVGALPTSTLSAVTVNGSSTLALGASQSVASLSGTISSSVNLNANTLTINGSSSTTYSGGISGTGNLVKNGSGTQTLAGATTFNGTTTVNSGTLQVATANALGGTSNVVINNGGSFLVTADDAIGTNTGIELNGGTLAFGPAGYDGNVGALTLSANSTIDLGTSSTGVLIRFNSINWSNANALLSIYNWTGTTQSQGGTGNNTDQVYFTNSTLSDTELQRISFYSDTGSSFVGNAFQITSGIYNREIIAVPETEAYVSAVALLVGIVIQYLRRRSKLKSLEGHRPA